MLLSEMSRVLEWRGFISRDFLLKNRAFFTKKLQVLVDIFYTMVYYLCKELNCLSLVIFDGTSTPAGAFI